MEPNKKGLLDKYNGIVIYFHLLHAIVVYNTKRII